MDVLGHGVYTVPRAAKLVRLPEQRVREWFRGRKSSAKQRKPVFLGDYQPIEDAFALSFLDLIDVYVAGQMRQHGVSLQTVRRVYGRLSRELNTSHPFCRKELFTDGEDVFIRGKDRQGEEEIYEAITKQKVFPKLILPFLKQIDYDHITVIAARWRIAPEVVLDPRICFGSPVVCEYSIPTYVLHASYLANGESADKVANWYNINSEAVLAAVSFEINLLAS